MCGIIVSTVDCSNTVGHKLRTRGPDDRTYINANNLHFVHYLLHMTGDRVTQPFISEDGNIIAIYNGEIYNYKKLHPLARSDGECIIPVYKTEGISCIEKFDGEFALVIVDFEKNLLIISSDVFRTKPLFYHVSEAGIVISTYLSTCKEISDSLEYTCVTPNTTLVYNLNTRKLVHQTKVYNFDLRQYKTSFDDWERAFEDAVLKRYDERITPVVFLSSGLDSGSIACCLHKFNKNFLALSIPSNEDLSILNKRKAIYGDKHHIKEYNSQSKQICNEFIRNHCENHTHIWEKSGRSEMVNDGCNGAKRFLMLYARTIIPSSKIAFSGIGADEIMNTHATYDYVNMGQVDFFPESLETVFPWRNFYEGSMRNYLLSDEYVAGSMGYETRYPFLDKTLVQEFLNLSAELKNRISKHPLVSYLAKNNSPYTTQKLGFNTA